MQHCHRLLLTAALLASTSQAQVLFDNGAANGSGGWSNATEDVFGARRTLLDDFIVPAGSDWELTAFDWTHIWSSGGQVLGTGLELSFRADAGGVPGPTLAAVSTTSYIEVPTGNVFFSRPEQASTATVDPACLLSGTYWIEATIVGPENNFWLMREPIWHAECWLNYDDFGGLQPGSHVTGAQKDMNFRLLGTDHTSGGIGTNYCTTNANSTGVEAEVAAFGSETVADNDLRLVASSMPVNEFGYFLASTTQGFVANPGGSQGNLCLGGTIGRFVKQVQSSGPGGTFCIQVDLTNMPPPVQQMVLAGETWNFQAWFRDKNPNPTSNFTDAVSVTFI